MEIWKGIKGFEGAYQVSNKGNVKSLDRVVNGKRLKGKILSPGKRKDGYLTVSLSKDGKGSTKKIHRLVAEAFIPNPDNKESVNHINCNKSDNDVSNLEWATFSENSKHAYDNGLSSIKKIRKKGVSVSAKNNARPVLRTGGGKPNKVYKSIMEASRDTGIHNSWIVACCQGRGKPRKYNWSYLNENRLDLECDSNE